MSFKEFVLKQDDDISEDEVTERYREYKIEFKRTQINDFFVLHKDEEWFKEKYHPLEAVTRTAEVRTGLKKRCRVFIELLEAGYVDRVSLEISQAGEVLKFLDRVLIKLDGGSDKELEELDSEDSNQNQTKKEEPAETADPPTESKPDVEEPAAPASADYKYEVDEGVGSEGECEPAPPGADEEEPLAPPGMEEEATVAATAAEEKKEAAEVKEEDGEDDEEEDVNINILHRGSLSFLFTDNAEKPSSDEKKDTPMEEGDKTDPAVEPPAADPAPYSYDGSQMKRPLSLFMRSLPPAITRQDLTDVCKRYPGFLRVAMADPQPDRRYFRLGWASFDNSVNIKDICWNLSNIRIKDNDLSPTVNKEVVNRVRPVTGLTFADVAMQLDLKLAAKVVKRLDAKHKLYEKETNGVNGDHAEVKQEGSEPHAAATTTEDSSHVDLPVENPVLASVMTEGIEAIVDCTIGDDGAEERKIDQNETLAQALDKILLYLRVVHCIDYYNGNNYSYEDEMPARCGIIHVRDTMPETTTKQSVLDWHKSNAEKVELLSQEDLFATEGDAQKLGLKDDEVEVNNFIKANTQELAKDKWLCPLSGKKFRGPDFIRKHILNKHVDSIDNVKAEVKYFNNYVRDMRRPCFPETKPGMKPVGGQQGGLAAMNPPAMSHTPSPAGRPWTPRQPTFASPRPPFTPQYNQPANDGSYGRMNTYPPKPVRRDQQQRRAVIKYKDLDAPDEGDFF